MLQARFWGFVLFCFSPSPWPLSHARTLTAQSLAQRPTRHSCSWTQAHLAAWDLGFALAKNSLGLTISVADPGGTENPKMSENTLIFCQEGWGGPAKCLVGYRHMPSSVVVPLLLSVQDKARTTEAVVVESGCGCSGGDGCDDRWKRWKRGKSVFHIYSSLSTSLLFPFPKHSPFIFHPESVQNEYKIRNLFC